jgi:hypothetical protein
MKLGFEMKASRIKTLLLRNLFFVFFSLVFACHHHAAAESSEVYIDSDEGYEYRRANVYGSPDSPRRKIRSTYNMTDVSWNDPARRTFETYISAQKGEQTPHKFHFEFLGLTESDESFKEILLAAEKWCKIVLPEMGANCATAIRSKAMGLDGPNFEWAKTCSSATSARGNIGFWLTEQQYKGPGVEVGVFQGHTSKKLLDTWTTKGVGEEQASDQPLLYLVDPWESSDDDSEFQDSDDEPLQYEQKNNVFLMNAEDATAHRKMTHARIAGYGNGSGTSRWREMRMYSLDAAALFEDNSLDFVYLDGAHYYAAIAADIAAWWPKLRSGGLLSGDDYNLKEPVGDEKNERVYPHGKRYFFGVKAAVDEFVAKEGLESQLGFSLGDWEYGWLDRDDPMYDEFACNFGIIKP